MALWVERTQSGLRVSSYASDASASAFAAARCSSPTPLLSDLAAASLVRRHVSLMRRRHRDSRPDRILRALLRPRPRGEPTYPLDDAALTSIFSSANELFFARRLSQRVTWDWSGPASGQYRRHVVGTTALRPSARLGGYETLIVLSAPILRDARYDRRLLIAAFLHEMIHCFLFVACGWDRGGAPGHHTEGFRQIAEVVDRWVGSETLRLRDVEADLERFRDKEAVEPEPERPCVYPGRPEWHGREGFRDVSF